MIKIWWHIRRRVLQKRAAKALERSRMYLDRYYVLSARAEKFFTRIKGEASYGADE